MAKKYVLDLKDRKKEHESEFIDFNLILKEIERKINKKGLSSAEMSKKTNKFIKKLKKELDCFHGNIYITTKEFKESVK